MLEARNVTKKYGKKTAVADATFLGERGRIHGLVGENGAGKTTLLKCMAGIYRPEGGSITYDGKPVYDNEKMLERVAFISDSQEFFSIYTAKGEHLQNGILPLQLNYAVPLLRNSSFTSVPFRREVHAEAKAGQW